jgi:hypothetical protein
VPYGLDQPLLTAGQPGIRQRVDTGQKRRAGEIGVVQEDLGAA